MQISQQAAVPQGDHKAVLCVGVAGGRERREQWFKAGMASGDLAGGRAVAGSGRNETAALVEGKEQELVGRSKSKSMDMSTTLPHQAHRRQRCASA